MAVKVGFVGTGGMAGAHMNTLKTFEDVEFVAMCDVAEDRAKSRANEFGGKAFTDFKVMFDKIEPPHLAHGHLLRIRTHSRTASQIQQEHRTCINNLSPLLAKSNM